MVAPLPDELIHDLGLQVESDTHQIARKIIAIVFTYLVPGIVGGWRLRHLAKGKAYLSNSQASLT
jgi:hypothetical protein